MSWRRFGQMLVRSLQHVQEITHRFPLESMKNLIHFCILALAAGFSNPGAGQSVALAAPREAVLKDISNVTLRANYPNPFNDQTVIEFSVSKPQAVKVTLFNVLGSKISTLLNERLEAGSHQITYRRPEDLPDGIYIYTVEAGTTSRSMRMIIRK